MENASKALLMGAGVLLAVLLMAIMVRLFNSAATVTQSYQSREVAAEIATFNANFTRFIGGVKGNNNTVTQSYATIYDIISVANFAWDYNKKMVPDPLNLEDENDPRIVHVNLKDGKDREYIISDLQNYNESLYNKLAQYGYFVNLDNPNSNNIATYEINIKAYNNDGRIIKMDFYPFGDSSSTIINNLKKIPEGEKVLRKN